MDLYQAILSRRSTRRYKDEPLDKDTLAMIDDIIGHVQPLVPENRFRVMRRDVVSGEDLIAAMGGYGRIISPPHYLVAYAMGERMPLVDLGFRMEQIAVQMVQLGISVCFIGSMGREDNVRVRFRLARGGRTGAFLIFGRAAETVGGRTLNAVIRRTRGGVGKLPVQEIFYEGSFDHPGTPPKHLAEVIEAGRCAPSANNVQPWRFLWRDGTLYLFLQKHSPRYGGKPVLQEYRHFDAGTCMANITMAMEVLGLSGHWSWLEDKTGDLPDRPEMLEPLSKLALT